MAKDETTPLDRQEGETAPNILSELDYNEEPSEEELEEIERESAEVLSKTDASLSQAELMAAERAAVNATRKHPVRRPSSATASGRDVSDGRCHLQSGAPCRHQDTDGS